MDLSVVIATSNRRDSLLDAIKSIEAAAPPGISGEVIIASNGCDATIYGGTSISGLEIRQVHEPRAGKSRALNRALREIRGDLIAFTDDDVLVSPRWLSEFLRASRSYPREFAFCGPIQPQFVSAIPDWLRVHPLAGILFARFEPGLLEGPLPPPLLPFGPNFAVRKSILRNIEFRLDLGPSDENGALFCEDTEFAAELRDRLTISTDSGGYIYLPEARVVHKISEHKLDFNGIMERCFMLGRSRFIRFRRVTHTSRRPRLLNGDLSDDPGLRLSAGAELNFYAGQACQAMFVDDVDRHAYLMDLLVMLRTHKYESLWSSSMRKWLYQVEGRHLIQNKLTQYETVSS
jgi:glycosyltransferase involved in cell wall biosynthesis